MVITWREVCRIWWMGRNIPTKLQQLLLTCQKTHEVAHCRGETRRPSDSLHLDVFIQLLFLICLVGNNISLNLSSCCLIKTHSTGYLSNPNRHRAVTSLDEDRLLGCQKVGHFAFHKIFFFQHYYK